MGFHEFTVGKDGGDVISSISPVGVGLVLRFLLLFVRGGCFCGVGFERAGDGIGVVTAAMAGVGSEMIVFGGGVDDCGDFGGGEWERMSDEGL